MSESFSYPEFIQRNLGFVSEEGQARLRDARVLVCGVGGMGGACLQALVRAGVGGFAIADFDRFEVSNMNRQVFANLDSVGVGKVAATVAQIRRGESAARRRDARAGVGRQARRTACTLQARCQRHGRYQGRHRALSQGARVRRDGYRCIRRRPCLRSSWSGPRSTPEERLGAPTVGMSLEAIDADATGRVLRP